MLPNTYQSGNFIELFNAQSKIKLHKSRQGFSEVLEIQRENNKRI